MGLFDSFFIPSNGEQTFSPDRTPLFLRIPLAAVGPNTENASFRLTSVDDPDFDQTLTMKDDLVEGDDFAELMFENVFMRGRFTLEADPGDGSPKIVLFKDKSFLDLSGEAPADGPAAQVDDDEAPSQSDIQAAKQREAYE